MARDNWWVIGLCALLCSGAVSSAEAQQLKPYFLVIVDTSGSMAWCSKGATLQQGANDCSCHVGNDCSAAFSTNRCGFPSNKIGDAKCALQRILDGTGGDATFGLMQFEHPCDEACQPTGARCTGNLNACGPECDDAQLAVAIDSGNANLMREWVDGECQGSCAGGFRRELTTGQWTPLAKSLQRANEYLRGQSASIPGWPSVTGGPTPGSPLTGDSQLQCRPVSVILLTDGDDTCVPTNMTTVAAPAAAAALNAGDPRAGTPTDKAFRTYVIGFGDAAGGGNFNPAVLNDIALRGGTDRYFPAQNEAELSLALSRIIADAQPPAEVCNNLDDDCDTKIDEGLPKYCNKAVGIDAPELCDEPDETNCDGQDDDCDGVIDEGLTNACGECGAVGKEVCDNVDNDCDSRVDEDTSGTGSCGPDKGECKTGRLVCTGGVEQCQGSIGPNPEVCDCKDNDCDGNIDEAGSDELCPGQRCAGCRCVDFCKQTSEFAAECGAQLTANFQPNGECLCVEDRCDHDACPKSTIEHDGEPQCAPDDPRVAPCVCKAGACVARCAGVTCQNGEVCDPSSGRCVQDNCRTLGCSDSQLCDPASGKCVDDPCANADCESNQVCRDGKCEVSCSETSCSLGQVCRHGECEADPCAGRTCPAGEVCDPDRGACIQNPCAGLVCKPGLVCSAATKECGPDPCWNVRCPGSQTCTAGECWAQGQSSKPTTTQTITEAVIGAGPRNLLATGGGGCACSVPGPATREKSRFGALHYAGFGLLALWGARRSQRRRGRYSSWLKLQHLAAVLWLLTLLTLVGCRVNPICIDCTDSGVPTGQSSKPVLIDDPQAGGGSAGQAATDAGKPYVNPDASTAGDASMPSRPTCVPTGEETCNDKDDDCDFKVDENVVPRMNTCNQVGVCAGTVPTCTNGAFTCRFGAKFEMEESLCDGLDNDCDGKVDESFDMLGRSCEVGVGACKATGKYKCNTSGKGLICDASPNTGGDEVCNGKDDDCDGMIDEPKSTPGSNPSYVKDDVVQVRGDLWIYKFEASRVDATTAAQGIVNTRACSREGVLPWTNVTYGEALAACESAEMTLCKLEDWVFACKSGPTQCDWSTSGSCTSYVDGACNGHTAATQAGDPDVDALIASGAKQACAAEFPGGRVFDLSGNAKEWTTGASSPETNPLRGGSYNNNAEGLRCDFDFALGAKDLRLPNIGFRCCSTQAP